MPANELQGETPKDEMRKAFEFWMSDEGKYPKAIERDSLGNYRLVQAAEKWFAWQAAWTARGEQDALICEERGNAVAVTTLYLSGLQQGYLESASAIRSGDSHDRA